MATDATAQTTPATTPAKPNLLKTVLIIALLTAIATAGGILMFRQPPPLRLSDHHTGDAELAERIRAVLDESNIKLHQHQLIAVAEVEQDSIRWAVLGQRPDGVVVDQRSHFELGSITKTWTGALLAEAIQRGEVEADDPLQKHLRELTGTPAGQVTLVDLAQHTSGLPRLDPVLNRRGWVSAFTQSNPYGDFSAAELLRSAASVKVTSAQGSTYSNLGMALLGEALRVAAGADSFTQLASERILTPLQMDHTVLATAADQIPATAVTGHHTTGAPRSHWFGAAYLPAGAGTFTTVDDIARWTQAQLRPSPSHRAALDPTGTIGPEKMGYGWLVTTEPGGQELTWHNGATAGFTSMLVVDRSASRGYVILNNSDAFVDLLGLNLIRSLA